MCQLSVNNVFINTQYAFFLKIEIGLFLNLPTVASQKWNFLKNVQIYISNFESLAMFIAVEFKVRTKFAIPKFNFVKHCRAGAR